MQNEIDSVAVAIIHSYSALTAFYCLLHFNATENEMVHSAIFRCNRFRFEGGGIKFDAHIHDAGQFSYINFFVFSSMWIFRMGPSLYPGQQRSK